MNFGQWIWCSFRNWLKRLIKFGKLTYGVLFEGDS